ncbi:hypothetical protein I4U23_020016 [Adineta vaga]|nr:hypothetical protein I4U23_020016 [Adineta vaga]
MASAMNKQKQCKNGLTCKRSNCHYGHLDKYRHNSYDPHDYYGSNDNQQRNKNFSGENQLDYDDEDTAYSSFYEQHNTNQDFSNCIATERQMSSYADVNENKNYFSIKEQSNNFHSSSHSWSRTSTDCKMVVSKSRFTTNILTDQQATVSSPRLQQLFNEIKVLFHEKVPEVSSVHQALIDEQLALQEADDDVKFSKETNLQELKDQLKTFENTISTLSTLNPTTLENTRLLADRLRRETQRLKARLPIYARRDELIDIVKSSNRVIILKADTGSGKSSQLIQYLVDAGLADKKPIVCTQPRRLAVRELSARVAKEFGCKVGEEVGYQVGASQPQISSRTKMRFVTDSVLLNEYQTDRMLSAYSIIIIDEAHERRVDTDLLFGALRCCICERYDIKLIIMSATLDEKLLYNYYAEGCIIEIPGRTFPIEDIYAMEDAENHVDEAINKVLEIHTSQPPGDILVFLTGQDEIDRAIDEVTKKIDPLESAIVLPLHGKLNEDETKIVFMPTSHKQQRKIIFSTNVAETSVTIEGIRYVIDSGMVKEAMWDSRRRMRVLKIGYTTQSSVKQRRGRAGRTSAGKCYHLYTYDTYQSLDICSRAEILCIQPSIAVLKLKHLKIVEDITKFYWLEEPSNISLTETINCLTWLKALNSKTGELTYLGRNMAKLGLEPMLSVMIFTGQQLNCLSHILALVGMLSVVQNVWWRSKDDQSKQFIDEIRSSFMRDTDIGGDYMVLLRIFLEWYTVDEYNESRKSWCIRHMIRWKSMKMANSFIRELAYQIAPNSPIYFSKLTNDLMERIVRCICSGFFQNLAISNGPIRAGYQLATSTIDTVARIHRSSTISYVQQTPKFILYHEILNINETNYLTVICPVELDWLNQSWLQSLPRSPSQCVYEDYTFTNMGPALLLSLVGRRCRKIPELEEQLNVLFEVDRIQSKLTIWGQKNKLLNAQQYIQKILDAERGKLRNELQEFEIIGSTRILLGAGAEPRLALVDEEYVKIFLTNLPRKITEEQIQEKCERYGQVRNVTMIRTNQNSTSASVTYVECAAAHTAVNELAREKWNDYAIHVRPSYIRTTVDTKKQSYTLKAQWFLTDSECSGRIVFSKLHTAQQAYHIFTRRHHFYCQFEISCANPTIRCTWPLTPHHGHAIVHFETVEQAQAAIEAQYEHPFRIEQSRRSNTSLYLRNVPRNLDETNLKTIFVDATQIAILRTRKNIIMTTPAGTDNIIRSLFDTYKSFQSQSIFVEPVLNGGQVVAYVQFTDEEEIRKVVNDINDMKFPLGSGILRANIQEQRPLNATTKRNELRKDEFRIKLSKLPSHVDEKYLTGLLDQHGISDSMTYIIVYRMKLPENYFSNRSRILEDENRKAVIKLKSLFESKNQLLSEPEIDIRSPTNDGRVVAYVRFHDPREIITANNICDSLDKITIQQTELNQLHFMPIVSHRIVLHETLAQAINKEIEQKITTIKEDSNFASVDLFKKPIMIYDKPHVLISIRGSNIQQLYKARILFDDLLKGLQFQLYNHLWVTILFDTAGQKFLDDLQTRTGTYIWWNWKSTFLRIFGEEQACQNAHKQISTYVQEIVAQREHSISIPIPKNCIRQCIQNSKNFRELNNKKTKVVINIIKHLIVISGDRETVTECEEKVTQILDNFLRISSHSNENKSTDTINICPICACDFDSPYALQQCGHTFCHSCLTAYFDTYFDVTISFDAFKLSCPLQHCNEVCLIRDIVSILGFERMARLAMIAFQIYIRRGDSNLVQCMGIDCKQVYRPSNCTSMYFCDQCIKVYCTSCEVEYHTGMTCEQYKKLHDEKDEDTILAYNLGKLSYKYCPKCRTPIDKYTGCNAVRCTLCDTQFCWRCLTTDDTDIHRHFTDPDSPCYNQMLDANLGTGGLD